MGACTVIASRTRQLDKGGSQAIDQGSHFRSILQMEICKHVGALIRAHRQARGWSQEGLAGRAGLHRTYVSSLERGLRNPTVTVLARIAAAMELTVSALLAGLEERVSKG